jgi:hypothetical protein
VAGKIAGFLEAAVALVTLVGVQQARASCLHAVLRGQLLLGRRPERTIIFNTWWLTLHFYDIVRVLKTRQFRSGPDLGARKSEIDQGRTSLSPLCPRRPASPMGEAKKKNYFLLLSG